MNDLYKNIKIRREFLKMTQDELAKKLGYKTRSSVNKIELGLSDIPQSKIEAFAKALNTTPGDLMGWDDDDELLKKIGAYRPQHLYKIPVYGRIRAGEPMLATEDVEGYEMFDVENPEEYFALKVTGDSMVNARIMDKDIVLIHKQDNG